MASIALLLLLLGTLAWLVDPGRRALRSLLSNETLHSLLDGEAVRSLLPGGTPGAEGPAFVFGRPEPTPSIRGEAPEGESASEAPAGDDVEAQGTDASGSRTGDDLAAQGSDASGSGPDADAAAEDVGDAEDADPTSMTTPPSTAEAEPLVPGRVSLQSFPWGTVYLDGHFVGNTPILEMRVSPGVHTIRIERPGYEPYIGNVTVGPGQLLRLTGIVLTEAEP